MMCGPSTEDILFTIEMGHSHRQSMLPYIFEVPLVAGRLNYRSVPEPCIFYCSLFIYDMLICIKNKLFDSFHNDISCIQLYFN